MDNYKQQAAEAAVDFVQSGMVVGLGAGSTALFAVRKIAQRLQEGTLRDIVGIPCSVQTGEEAARLGIPLSTLDEHAQVDVTIDGADEVDPACNVIKGGGGALLREKIVAQASAREIIVVDEGKLSPALGTRFAVPVEVTPFAWRAHQRFLESLGARASLRCLPSGEPYHTDQHNLILDADFGPIANVHELARQLEAHAGIIEHGLFLGLATEVMVAGPSGLRQLKP
jgi:ribose 5-phosphate isomerase A